MFTAFVVDVEFVLLFLLYVVVVVAVDAKFYIFLEFASEKHSKFLKGKLGWRREREGGREIYIYIEREREREREIDI